MHVGASNPLSTSAELTSMIVGDYKVDDTVPLLLPSSIENWSKPPVRSSVKLVNAVHNIFIKLYSMLANIDFGIDPVNPRTIANKIISYTISTLDGIDVTIRSIISGAMAIKDFTRNIFFIAETIEFMTPILEIARTVGIALAPLYLYQFVNGIYEYATDQMETSDFLVNSFKMAAEFLRTIGVFLRDLAALGKAPLQLLVYTWPLEILSLIIAASSAVSHGIGWYRTANFIKDFEKLPIFQSSAGQITNEEIDAFVDFIQKQDARHVKQIFDVSQDKLLVKIEKVAKRAKVFEEFDENDDKKKLAQEDVKNALESLRGRAKSQLVCHQVGVVAESINCLAHTLLFVTPFLVPICPPILVAIPVGYGLKGLGGTILFGEFMYGAIKSYQFNKSDLMQEKSLFDTQPFTI